MCRNAPVDSTWPVITTVDPNKGPPSTKITIRGFFQLGETYSVTMEAECTNVTLVNDRTVSSFYFNETKKNSDNCNYTWT